MALKNKLIVLLVGMLLLNLMFAAAAVTFKLEIPNQNNIKSGDTFSIKVLLDVPSADEIKMAEFILTPSSGITIASATSGSLLTGATTTFNTPQTGGGYKYGETTASGTAVSGNNLLFATLTATADAAGDSTFTFSGLKAKKGMTTRIVTSTSTTITIQADVLPTCTADDWSAGAFGACSFSTGGACGNQGTQTRTVTKTGNCDGDDGKPATTQSCSASCLNGGTCSTSGDCDCPDGFTGALCQIGTGCVAESDADFCSRLEKNCGSVTANNNCDVSKTVNCGTCSGSQTCTDNVCVAPSQATKSQALQQTCDSVNDADFEGDGALGKLVSKLAKKLKDLFS